MAEKNTSKEKVVIDFKTNADAASSDVDGLNASIEQTTESVKENSKALSKQDEDFKSLKTQLREANAELQKSIQLYGETSEQTIKAAKGVAELKDQIGFAKDLSETFNPDQKFKALGAATQLAGTGLQGVTAGMALFGDQTQDTEKMLLKVQSAMAFSDAISNVSELADQWSILKASIASSSIVQKANTAATGAAAIVQNLFTGSVTTTTTGFKALKFAIAATGIGLLVVGLVAVVQNFDKISKAATNLIPGLKGVGNAVMSIVQSVTDFIGVTSEADRTLDRLKENADASIALNKKFLAEHGSQLDEFTKQKIEAKNEYSEAIKEDGANQVALAMELNRKLAAIEYSRGDEARKKAEEDAKEVAALREKNRLQAIEDEKKRVASIMDERKKLNEQSEEFASFVAHAQDEQKEDKAEKEKQEEEERKKKLAEGLQQSYDNSQSHMAIEKAEADFREDINNNAKDNAEKLLQFAASGAIKNKQIQKAAIIADGGVAIGKTIANTAQAIGQDLKLGFPANIAPIALDAAVGATSVASIVSGTQKALQAVGGGSAPSAGATPSAPAGVGASPQSGFQASSENQIATSIAKSQQALPPIQTYVVGSQVTTQQSLDAKLIKENSFG